MLPKAPHALFFSELGLMILLGLAVLSWGVRHNLASHALIPVYFSFGYHVTALCIYLQEDWRARLPLLIPGRILSLFLSVVWSLTSALSPMEDRNAPMLDAETFLVPAYALAGVALTISQFGLGRGHAQTGAP